jgi:hypothetical protein
MQYQTINFRVLLIIFFVLITTKAQAQQSWTKVSNVTDHYNSFLKLKNGKLLCSAGSNGNGVNNIYESTDLKNWTANSSTFPSQIHLFFGQSSNGDIYIPTAHNGVYKSTNNGSSWNYNFGSGYGCGALAFNEDTSGVIYIGVGGFLRGIYTSSDFGINWTNKLSGMDFTNISTNRFTNRTFVSVSTVYYTDNNGSNWTQITSEPFSSSTALLKVFDSSIFVVRQNGDIYKSTNNGNSWNLHSQVNLTSNASVYANSMVQNSNGDFWLSFNQHGVWYLKNQTTKWIKQDSLLPTITIDLFIQNDTLLASTENGIYMRYGGRPISNRWNGTANFTSTGNWSTGAVPSANDSVSIKSGTLTINQSTTLDIMTVLGSSTVKLAAPLTLRNLHLKNGTIDLNGYKLTVTGRIYQSTDSTNYYIQAGTSAAPKPRSELAIKPSTAANSTLYFNPNANRLNKLEIGNGTAVSQITLANAVKIKGGEDGGTGPGLLTVNKNAKIIIANGSSLTLESDTFNAGLSLGQPAQRSIVCQGTGKFNIERDHFGARGWRLYAHPFKADIDLQEVANDIELIGPGGTAEGFYSNTNTNASAYWYDYSKADSTASSDPAWTAFTSAKGSTISGNANKWNKNSPMLLFNPGNRRGTDAFGSPTTATYEQGKISLSYTLDSTSVHLNDGTTQTVTATNIPSYVPTNGLVGYWPFNGNANDESGNGNHGTIVNILKDTTNRFGNKNSALSFDGNSYIKIPTLDNLVYSPVTYSGWIKISNYLASNGGFNCKSIIGRNKAYELNCGKICLGSVNGAFSNELLFWRGGGTSTAPITNKTISLDSWIHFTFTYNTNGDFQWFINGILTNNGNFTNTLNYFADFMIGSDNNNTGSSDNWDGLMDDFCIWDRVLNATEISNLYNASTNTNISAKSKYFFITNPFTTPMKLGRIQGLNATNVDPSFYYWKQRRNTVTNNFSPAEWQAERIFNGTALRDSNIAIPAFGTILVRLKNNNTTFTIPESAKQLSNFDYIIGGAKGTSKTGLMFLDASASDVGNNGLEIKLLVNDSQEADRVLVYNEPMQSANFTTADAPKYLNLDFPNVFTVSADAKPLALDMQDIKAELDKGKPEVAIPLAVNREANKRFPTLKWEISANTTGLDVYLRNRGNGSTELWSVGVIKTIAIKSDASEIRNYELVFKRNSSSTEDLTQKPNLSHRAPLELIAYPNPVEDKLHLKVINAGGEVPFHIYSITGVKVMDGSVKSEKTINTAALIAGVYVIDAGGVKVKFIKK